MTGGIIEIKDSLMKKSVLTIVLLSMIFAVTGCEKKSHIATPDEHIQEIDLSTVTFEDRKPFKYTITTDYHNSYDDYYDDEH